MRIIVVGLGVQGHKRRRHAGDDCVATIDSEAEGADYRSLEEVPLADYDAALVCVPDESKAVLLRHLFSNGKHALVEKPLWAVDDDTIVALEKLARANDAVCYTAYNHRFEPHFVRMKRLLESNALGRIYHCRMFYGNGTARLVRESAWRDKGAGVLPDLGSHLLDTVDFWFGNGDRDWSVRSANCFENRAPDHVVLQSGGTPEIELEITLLSWRNHFTADVLAEKGSAHISSLCKWGPSTFVHRTRVLPSGRPPEDGETLDQEDPTWALEYEHFKALCRAGKPADLKRDVRLNRLLRTLGEQALDKVAP